MNFFAKAVTNVCAGAAFGYGAGTVAAGGIVGLAIMDSPNLTFRNYSINFIYNTIPLATSAICATFGLLLAIGSSICESDNENNQVFRAHFRRN